MFRPLSETHDKTASKRALFRPSPLRLHQYKPDHRFLNMVKMVNPIIGICLLLAFDWLVSSKFDFLSEVRNDLLSDLRCFFLH